MTPEQFAMARGLDPQTPDAVIRSMMLEELQSFASSPPTRGLSDPAPRAPIADELAKLAELRDKGVLTEDEFKAQKARLLT
jgi:hypothetical protein